MTVDLYANLPQQLPPSHRNLLSPKTLRPTLDPAHGGLLQVDLAGQLVALDVTVGITLRGAGTIGDPVAALEDARVQVAGQLRDAIVSITDLSVPHLLGKVVETDTFTVTSLTFAVEYVEDGVRFNKTFTGGPPADHVALTPLQRPWIRSVRLAGGGA